MLAALLLLAIALIVGAISFNSIYFQHTQTQIMLAQIASQNRLDLAPYVLAGLVIIGIVIVLVVYLRRPPATKVIHDNRVIYLLQPGASKRESYRALEHYAALPLAEGKRAEVLESQPVKRLGGER